MDDPDSRGLAQTEHPDAAGWVLGVLDPDDSARFSEHLRTCEECEQAVAELGPAARLLQTALPAIELMENPEPPADLAARTLARVAQAARKPTWRRPGVRLVAVGAAAAVIAAVVAITVSLIPSAPTLAFSFSLHAPNGGAASADVTAQQNADGWSIRLTAQHLNPLPSGSFYECWYAGPGNRPGQPDLITAGTFTVDSRGDATVQMWSAADPRQFPTMQITVERPGNATQQGPVILTGNAHVGG
jgi:anti-sigma-K factor RskA